MSGVVVLNTDNTALHTVSVKHAIKMLVREVAIVEEARDGHSHRAVSLAPGSAADPLCQDNLPLRADPTWSKRGVFRRDHHRCAYCESNADTVDHLLPQSRGGQNTWLNTVAACTRCNNLKANRTPKKRPLALAWKLTVPTWREAYHRRG